jgi:activator of HSP90 ATPase
MPTLKQVYEINASADDVFDALVKPEMIERWSGDEAKMGDNVGDEFSLWSGQMFGKNLEVLHGKKLVQEWNYENWEAPSRVTLLLKSKSKNKTIVELIHEDIPEKAFRSIESGWDEFYLGAIQRMFEEKVKI